VSGEQVSDGEVPRRAASSGDASGVPDPPEASSSAPVVSREHPTLPPPFDLEEFARKETSNDGRRVAPSDRPTEPAPIDPSSSLRSRKTRRAIARVTSELDGLRSELTEKFCAGDYVAALAVADMLVARSPNDSQAEDFAIECRRMLERTYSDRLGPLDQVPRLLVPLHELRGRGLDHQAGFLLSRVDGESTLEALLDVSAMPRLAALRVVVELVGHGILSLERSPRTRTTRSNPAR
jgi:hypothetical protein